ncbi:hypothetical protein BKA70DRAFT_1066138, partial [Coprinopsis sp. MPI-PUGE-AT-0042]
SLRRAAKDFLVHKTTLTARFNGRKTRAASHEFQQKLTAGEEATIVEWIKVQGHQGVPLSPSMLCDLAESI